MIDEKDVLWGNLKGCQNLKEYIFMTRSGYRHFFVLGKDLKRCGFTLDDLPIRLENKPETKTYTIEDLWNKNENHK